MLFVYFSIFAYYYLSAVFYWYFKQSSRYFLSNLKIENLNEEALSATLTLKNGSACRILDFALPLLLGLLPAAIELAGYSLHTQFLLFAFFRRPISGNCSCSLSVLFPFLHDILHAFEFDLRLNLLYLDDIPRPKSPPRYCFPSCS